MATVHEQLQSRQLSVSGGKVTGTRAFHVWDDTTPITRPVDIVLGADGLPQIGDLFPGEVGVYAVSFNAEPLGDGKATWRVTFSYGPGSNSPNDLLYVERTTATQAVFLDAYRINVPSAYGGLGSNGQDIGGVPIDSGGIPTSILGLVVSLTISENIRDVQMPGRLAMLADAVGKRNVSVFEGFAPGTLVYVGFNSSRVNINLFRIEHRFEYRSDYHMVQVPRRNSQQSVLLAFQPQYGFHAERVSFVQPFQQLYDFNLISDNF